MVAVGVVHVPIYAGSTGGQASAEFIGKDAPAQLLGGEDFVFGFGEAHVQAGLNAPFFALDKDIRSLFHGLLLFSCWMERL